MLIFLSVVPFFFKFVILKIIAFFILVFIFLIFFFQIQRDLDQVKKNPAIYRDQLHAALHQPPPPPVQVQVPPPPVVPQQGVPHLQIKKSSLAPVQR